MQTIVILTVRLTQMLDGITAYVGQTRKIHIVILHSTRGFPALHIFANTRSIAVSVVSRTNNRAQTSTVGVQPLFTSVLILTIIQHAHTDSVTLIQPEGSHPVLLINRASQSHSPIPDALAESKRKTILTHGGNAKRSISS